MWVYLLCKWEDIKSKRSVLSCFNVATIVWVHSLILDRIYSKIASFPAPIKHVYPMPHGLRQDSIYSKVTCLRASMWHVGLFSHTSIWMSYVWSLTFPLIAFVWKKRAYVLQCSMCISGFIFCDRDGIFRIWVRHKSDSSALCYFNIASASRVSWPTTQ